MSDENKNLSEEVGEVVGSVAKTYVDIMLTRLKWAAIIAGVLAVFVLLCMVFK